MSSLAIDKLDLEVIEVEPQQYHTSGPTKDRRNARRQANKDPDDPPAKPGAKSTFTGQRMDLMLDHMDGLALLHGAAQKEHNKFWRNFFALYWNKFNWQLPLDREPQPGDVWKSDKELTEEENLRKKIVVTKTQRVTSPLPDLLSFY